MKKKEMIPLTDKECKSCEKQKVCYICKKKYSTHDNDDDNKKYQKVRGLCHYTGKFRGTAHDISNLRYKTSRKIPIVSDNGSTYDYLFIIKQVAKEFDGQPECLGENTDKYISFSVSLKRKT